MFSRLRRAREDVAAMQRLFPEAERLAHADGLELPGAEHLLLAALELDDDGLAVLAELGVGRGDLAAAIDAQYEQALRSVGVVADDAAIDAALPDPPLRATGIYRSTPAAQQLFGRAVATARSSRSPLRSTHVLLAATEADRGTLARTFDALGIDRAALAGRIRRQLA